MLSIRINPHDAIGALDAFGEKQLAFGTSLALNRTAEEVQDAQRQRVFARFAVRTASSATFLSNMIKIARDDRATKYDLRARVRIEGPGHEPQKALLLTRHIDGGAHTMPGGPLSSFFIPADALRPSRLAIVPRQLYPKNLRLMDRKDIVGTMHAKRHVTKSGAVQLKGKLRTFVLTEKGSGRPLGVFQREGPHDIQMLWLYSKRITIRPQFDFFGIAERTFVDRWPANFLGMMRYAIATAR